MHAAGTRPSAHVKQGLWTAAGTLNTTSMVSQTLKILVIRVIQIRDTYLRIRDTYLRIRDTYLQPIATMGAHVSETRFFYRRSFSL